MREDPEALEEDVDAEIEVEHSSAIRGFLVGVVVGLVAGAGTALLLAPERGRVVRRRIKRSAKRASHQAGAQLDVWRRRAERRARLVHHDDD
jgi:hypothetical protein